MTQAGLVNFYFERILVMFRTAVAIGGLLALYLVPSVARAAMTPQEAWEFVLSLNAGYGVTMESAARDEGPDELILHDVSYAMPLPGGTLEGSIGEIRLTRVEGGDILFEMSAQHMMRLQVVADDQSPPLVADVLMETPGLSISLAGTPDDALIDYFAPAITLSLDGIESGANRLPLQAVVDLEGLEMTYRVAGEGPTAVARETITDGTIAAAGFVVSLAKPGGDGQFDAEGAFVEIGFSGSGASGQQPVDLAETTLPELLRQGFESDLSLSHTGSDLSFSLVDGTANAAGHVTSDNGRLDLSLSQAGLRYAGATEAIAASFESSELPMPPVSAQAEALEFSVGLPVQKSDTPEDVDILVDVAELSLADPIWQMLDPMGVLPREPASLVIDMAAKANWFGDILEEPEAIGAIGPEAGEIHALDVRRIRLRAAGADLTGAGSFTFDNKTPSPFGPGPKPVGHAQLRLDGAEALLQNLTRMGLLPQQQAMMAQMMLGMFGRTVEGEDAVTSEIEITPDGGILANGQRVQ